MFLFAGIVLLFIISVVIPVPAQTAGTAAEDIRSDAKSEINVTNGNDGYIRARTKAKTSRKLKLITTYVKSNGATVEYRYDLNGDGVWETYSLQSGNGKYTIMIGENVTGARYSIIQTINIEVTYNRMHAPFLISAQHVNYAAGPNAVKKADELCKNAATDLAKVEGIYKYIVETIEYDMAKANKITAGDLTGYLPNVDDTLQTSKGICFDFSSLFAAMLRSQGIPSKLIMGYVAVSPKPVYHAWNEVYIEEVGWIKIRSEVNFNGKDWRRMDSTFAAGNANGKRTRFISDDKNYTTEKEY